ncbi:hypothetical protein MPLB_2300045 [Mesorhizobium sp. ORS 3324]|nr:hypothetical protein MPLB_2300045 [Mesorhizobium sp. ORS 3324]
MFYSFPKPSHKGGDEQANKRVTQAVDGDDAPISAWICPEKYRLTGEARTGCYAACGVPPPGALQFSDARVNVNIVGNADRCRNKPKSCSEASRECPIRLIQKVTAS